MLILSLNRHTCVYKLADSENKRFSYLRIIFSFTNYLYRRVSVKILDLNKFFFFQILFIFQSVTILSIFRMCASHMTLYIYRGTELLVLLIEAQMCVCLCARACSLTHRMIRGGSWHVHILFRILNLKEDPTYNRVKAEIYSTLV
jgi:hypothetical protein